MTYPTLTLFLIFSAFSCFAQALDTVPPTIVCQQHIYVTIPPTGLLSLSAGDFIDTVYDNSGLPIELAVRKVCTGTGFPQGGNFVTYTYLGAFGVESWARDQTGNTSTCRSFLFVMDIGNTEPYSFYASANTPEIDHISAVDYHMEWNHCVDGQNAIDFFEFDPHLPNIAFSGPEPGSEMTLAARKSINPQNGITTGDLYLIQKHILAIQALDSPYQLIAADANQDGKITTFDILLLRKLMLGLINELPNGKSWRFVPAHYQFPDPHHPFPFPEHYYIPQVSDPQWNNFQFTGIKIGDVDFSADPQQ